MGGEVEPVETTNIRMEGLALLAAMQDAVGEACEIYSDSEFWINVITKWSLGWEANGWRKKGGEIKNLDMPPMTMVFTAKDPAMLDSVAVGDKVRFVVIDEGGKMVVTVLQKRP